MSKDKKQYENPADDDGWNEVKPVLFGVVLVLAAALSALMGMGLWLAAR